MMKNWIKATMGAGALLYLAVPGCVTEPEVTKVAEVSQAIFGGLGQECSSTPGAGQVHPLDCQREGYSCCQPTGSSDPIACWDTEADPEHCGRDCGPCAGNEFCDEGSCSACPTGEVRCDGNECTDTTTDFSNCGGCGVACKPETADQCVNGTCQCGAGAACPLGQECSGGTCVTPCEFNFDCNPGELCSKSSLGGSGVCETVAAGAAGTSCTPGSAFSQDRPCNIGFTSNGTSCTDPCTDPTHCGAFGTVCGAVTPYCCIVGLTGGTMLGVSQCEDVLNPPLTTCDFPGEYR